ncbi:MAG: YbaB/EbfC family nucleoid-associated protein [Pisciglobus halotolerans]|nr:YbaB/EbfC family nucleoid-associated protein [Pisciglobus halotolerans]
MRGMGNMQGMMKKMQKMQKEMEQAQKELNEKEFKGTANGDLVVVTFTGDKRMTGMTIKPDVIDPEDSGIMEDLILLATNDALEKIDVETEQVMGKYTKGMNIPGL